MKLYLKTVPETAGPTRRRGQHLAPQPCLLLCSQYITLLGLK